MKTKLYHKVPKMAKKEYASNPRPSCKDIDNSISRKSIVELQMLSKMLLLVCKNLHKKIRE